MRKSVIAFGILFSVMTGTVTANVKPIKDKVRSTATANKNVAPLSLAIVQDDYQTVKRFLELGSDIEVRDKTMGMTPLMYAARYNNVPLLKLLIANGAKAKETSKLRLTAVQYAKHANATDAVAFLNNL